MAIDPSMDPAGPDGGLSGLNTDQVILDAPVKDGDVIPRDKPDLEPSRERLVTAWISKVKAGKTYWDKAFKRMRDDQDFCYGMQWSKNADDTRYTANLTLRLVAQKTAFLYAKNPKAIARRRERIENTVWDGTQTQLQQLIASGAMLVQQLQQGGPPPMGTPGGMPVPPGLEGMGIPSGSMQPAGMPTGGGGPPVGQGADAAAMSGMVPPYAPGGAPGGAPAGMPPGMLNAGIAGASAMAGPGVAAMIGPALAIMQEAAKIKAQNTMLDKLGRTLELLYEYNVNEQVHPFKTMMKMVVRRAVTTGVGYVKLGFERVMEKRPDKEKGIADASERLATLERLSADYADAQFDDNAKEMEQLKLLIQDLSQQVEFVAREGLVFDYPVSTAIIPDPKTIELKNWIGSDWVAEEFIMSPYEVQEIYGIDIGKSFTAYKRADYQGPDPIAMARQMQNGTWEDRKEGDTDCAAVWQIYSRKDGLVYTVCDGWNDFLREPASPEIYNEHFYPWYPLIFNACDNENEIFPPSDVRIMRDMQMEYNRCREGLKEHRIAARPFTAVVAGAVDEEDLDKISNRDANAIVELNALQPNQDVKQLLQPFAGPGIDPNLYEVNPVYEDILRTTGIQEANLGGTSDATATQAQIAEGSRMTSMGSNIDDLNDLLSQLARNGGQILLSEVAAATVTKIVGAGAVWPQMSKQDIMQEVLLEIEAGSMGRPNAAAEVANAQRLYPLLIQLPGIDPEFLARDLLRRLDDRLDLTQAFKSQLPSVVALNGMVRGQAPMTGAPAGAAQGEKGGDNAPKPEQPAPGGPPDMTQQLTGAGPSAAPGSPTLQ